MSRAKLVSMIGAAAAALAVSTVAYFEGYVPVVYADPIGRMAVCYGHDDQMLRLGERYTREQCESLLADDLVKHAAALDCFKRPLTDGQKAAIVSFAFNVGAGAVCKSTLARKANAGYPAVEWCSELKRWTLAGGRQLPGLVKRRAAEYRLCVQ